ncbi:MAG: hypothetical protein QXI65_03825 [Metallosphaera sp.]
MAKNCIIKSGYETCVEICGRLICDEATVREYSEICEQCNKGNQKACLTLYSRFGCWSSSGWWL